MTKTEIMRYDTPNNVFPPDSVPFLEEFMFIVEVKRVVFMLRSSELLITRTNADQELDN